MILELELVPSSCFYKNVRQILSTTDWKSICKQIYNQCNYKCEICGGIGNKHPVEAHETWEYDLNSLTQKLIYIKGLCPLCHSTKHFGLAELQGKRNLVLSHLMKINKISNKEAELYIKEQFLLWQFRSSKQWKLDISFLKNYNEILSKKYE